MLPGNDIANLKENIIIKAFGYIGVNAVAIFIIKHAYMMENKWLRCYKLNVFGMDKNNVYS